MNSETQKQKRRTVKRKPTLRQRRIARLIVDTTLGRTDIKTDKELILKAGYSEGNAKSTNSVIDTPGVQEALNDLGFTTDNAKKVVQKILNNEDAENRDRLKAADMVFKVHGEYATDKIAAKNNANPVIFAKIEQHVTVFEAKLKEALGYVLEEKSE